MNKWNCRKVENCFADTQTYAYFLSFPITEDILEREGEKGKLRIKKNFRRPCYFFDLENGIRMKGLLNDTQMKVSFPNEGWEAAKTEFEQHIIHLFQPQEGVDL